MASPNANSRFIMQPLMPGPLSEERFARNGDVPSSMALRRAAWQYNHVAMHQRKMLFSAAYPPQDTPAPATTSTTNIHFCFRTGEAVDKIRVVLGMAPASSSIASSLGECSLQIVDAAAAVISSGKMQHPKVAAGLYPPSDVLWATEEISVADGLLPNTVYRGQIRQSFWSRVHSVMVYEVGNTVAASSDTGIANPLRWEGNKPIYAEGAQDFAETGTLLHKHNAAHLIGWCAPTTATAPSISSTSYVNILDQTKTAYGAANPGWVLNTEFHDTERGDVEVELAIYATRTSGSGSLDIQLQNSAGTVLTETTITAASSPCATSAHTILAIASDKTDILAKVSSGTWRIGAIGLWEYEA